MPLLHLLATIVTDYGDENPLYFDYYGAPPALYQLKFKSRGDLQLANRIVDLYNKVGDLDPLRTLITLTCVFPGRVDRQDHIGFRAPWRGWSGENILRFGSWCLHPIPTHVRSGDGHTDRRGFDRLEL